MPSQVASTFEHTDVANVSVPKTYYRGRWVGSRNGQAMSRGDACAVRIAARCRLFREVILAVGLWQLAEEAWYIVDSGFHNSGNAS